MDYKKHYDLLISKRGLKEKPLSGYYELHHILPKSMGGSDKLSNLVYLTAREHFVAHWLLWRIHRNRKMAAAFFGMFAPRSGRKIPRTGTAYEEARKSFSENHYMKQKEWQEYFSNSRKGSDNPMFGRKNVKNMNSVNTPFGVFQSISSASIELSLDRSTIRTRCNSVNHPDWYYISKNVDTAGRNHKTVHTPKGVFSFLVDAALAYSVHPETIARWAKNKPDFCVI